MRQLEVQVQVQVQKWRKVHKDLQQGLNRRLVSRTRLEVILQRDDMQS
jgi:hypothetical protein